MRNLDYLRAFIAVVDEGSFKEAAQRLHVAPATVSFRVQSLEKELDATLLIRKGHAFELTPEGRHAYERGKDLLLLEGQIRDYIDNRRQRGCGRVLVGSGRTTGSYLMPGIIADFNRKRPDIQIELQIASSRETIHKLLENRIDIAVLGAFFAHEDLEIVSFLSYELLLVVSPRHPLAARGTVAVSEVLEHPMVMREKGSLTRQLFEKGLRSLPGHPGEPKVAIELNNTEAVKGAVRNGLGLAFVFPWAVENEVAAGNLVRVPVRDFNVKREVFIAYNRRWGLHRAAQAFWRFLESRSRRRR
ncbi:MAG: LysR family transcriptional regulator [Bacillota bacterium]|nr:LysR family transcriptional regulator [Bacillota bacterium]